MVDGYYWFLDAESDWEIVQVETMEDPVSALSGLTPRPQQYVWFFGRDGIHLTLCLAHGRFEGPIVKTTVLALSAQIAKLRLEARGEVADALAVAAEALEMIDTLEDV